MRNRLLAAAVLAAALCLPPSPASARYCAAGRYWTTHYGWSGNMTRTEVWPTWGGVAVDPDVIPLGSTVYIAAYDRTFIANDTGGLVIGRTLDVYGGWLTQCSAAWIVGGD